MLLIIYYALIKNKNDNIKNKFYEDLDMLYDILLAGKPKMELGDFNAKIRKENKYKLEFESLHEVTNDNKNKLITFATDKNMIASNTNLPHKIIYKQTWISPCNL